MLSDHDLAAAVGPVICRFLARMRDSLTGWHQAGEIRSPPLPAVLDCLSARKVPTLSALALKGLRANQVTAKFLSSMTSRLAA